MIPTDQPKRLITYHGTVVYFDKEINCLRHGKIEKCEANVYAIKNSDGTTLFWQDGDISRPVGSADPRKITISDEGQSLCFLTTDFGKNIFSFETDKYFICAEPNGEVNCSRLVASTWESFLLIDLVNLFDLSSILSTKWLCRTALGAVENADAELLEAHLVRVGRVVLPVCDVIEASRSNDRRDLHMRDLYLSFDGWKIEHFVLYRPLAYFCAYGKDEIFDLLEIAVHSLFEFGLWEGDVLIITEIERVDLVRQLLEPFGEKIFIEALPAEDILDFTLSRYKIMNIDICNRYQPIIYLDTDVVSDLPIHEYMKERAFKSHFDVVEELFLGHTEDFYGKTLLELDGVGFGQSELGLSSGIFSFRNIVEQSEVFCLILKSATKAGEIFGRRHFRFFDQPFFNYVIYKTQPAISVQLSTFVKVHFSNSPFLTEPVCKGFVHFAGGVGNSSPKIKQMTYYVEVLRNDRTAK